jgi:hypothetical protein
MKCTNKNYFCNVITSGTVKFFRDRLHTSNMGSNIQNMKKFKLYKKQNISLLPMAYILTKCQILMNQV